MNLTGQINIRVDNDLKKEAEAVLKKLGMKTTDAIRMFLTQITLTKSLPMQIKLPNKTTIDAIEAGEKGEVTTVTSKEFDKMLGL